MTAIKKVRFPIPGGRVVGLDGKERKCTHIECKVGYTLGGVSYWDYHRYERGYYAYVKPITIERREGGYEAVSFEMFGGAKFLLVGCGRQSPRRQAEAVAKFDAEVRDYVAKLYDVADIEFTAA